MLGRSYRPVPKLGIRGWLLFLVVAIALGAVENLIPHQFARPFRLPTGSMEPTIMRATICWFRPQLIGLGRHDEGTWSPFERTR